MNTYINRIKALADDALDKWDVAVFENPTNIGKEDLVRHLVDKHGRTLLVSQSLNINRQWNDTPDIAKKVVYVTYHQFSAISHDDIYDFCSPYNLIIFDEAHHAGAKGYSQNILRIMGQDDRKSKIFGMTTHTKRYSDSAEDVAQTVFEGHKINGISFEDAIKEGLLPQFDYISALYSLPKDIDDIVAASSLAKKIVSDSRLVQVNEDGIKEIIRKHMPYGKRKVVYFVPSIEDSLDAEKMAAELGYGEVYSINYTKSDKENSDALKAYNEADTASLVCISKFNEGAIPKGTNSVVVLRRTTTINIFERQVLTALFTADEKPVVYDFVSNIDNLIYSRKDSEENIGRYYTERIKSLCSQSIVIDYARQWTTVFNKLRSLTKSGWTQFQDDLLRKYYPKYGKDVYKYIKGHNMKECILRAEILGIEYAEKVPEKKEKSRPPYTVSLDEIENAPAFAGLTDNVVKKFCKAYEKTLNTGEVPASTISKISLEKDGAKDSLIRLAVTCVKATKVTIPEKEQEIKKRQNAFKTFVEGYAGYSYRKSSNMVILDGKAKTSISKKEIDRHLAEKKFEKKKDRMVKLEDRYMDKSRAVAGRFGETVAEHTLYRTYYKIVMTSDFKPKASFNYGQFLIEHTADEINNLIRDLRHSENPWTKDDINHIKTAGKNPEVLYKELIKAHSDLDILKKSEEVGNDTFTAFCQKRTRGFEKGYPLFYTRLTEESDQIEAEKERKRKIREQQEEGRKKNEAQKKRLKNLKPTVVLVSKKPRKKEKE